MKKKKQIKKNLTLAAMSTQTTDAPHPIPASAYVCTSLRIPNRCTTSAARLGIGAKHEHDVITASTSSGLVPVFLSRSPTMSSKMVSVSRRMSL